MFGPEYQNMDCPKCRHRKVYFDREIGYYCMFCGHGFGAEQTESLIETITSSLRSIPEYEPLKMRPSILRAQSVCKKGPVGFCR